MLFNTLQFGVFFIIVYLLYIFLGRRQKLKWQNLMLLAASYFFYGTWDWRFLSLILISTGLDYYCGIKIDGAKEEKTKKRYLLLSIVGNLAILGFFKYFNFFASGFKDMLSIIGIAAHPFVLNIILPVGISFYTFQTMSYTFDVYRKEIKATTNYIDFSLYVAFFPQLVAGPIERAKHLLPQVISPRKVTLNAFYEGCYLTFWGLFEKIVIADNLAKLVDPVFSSYGSSALGNIGGGTILLSLYAFAFQIFCDFDGYCNIARGVSRMMGFDIMNNFNIPYLSANPREFWQRWHISLSTWLKDYLYIPLGGNRNGKLKTVRNIIVVFLLGGLWHGAAWTFVIWGLYHGTLMLGYKAVRQMMDRTNIAREIIVKNIFLGKSLLVIRIFIFFNLVSLGWLFFRSKSVAQAFAMLGKITDVSSWGIDQTMLLHILFLIGIVLIVQIYQYIYEDIMAIYRSNVYVRILFYVICIILFIAIGEYGAREFIYFQF